MDLEKVINLFQSKHTAQLSDRHAAAIKQLCSDKLGGSATAADADGIKIGFFYKDLPQVAQVLDFCR
jgi:hypothetical protein